MTRQTQLTPLTPRREALHLIRNHLTFIAGTAFLLGRQAVGGALDPDVARERVQRLEPAAWQVDALLDQALEDWSRYQTVTLAGSESSGEDTAADAEGGADRAGSGG